MPMLTPDEARRLTAKALSFSQLPECEVSLTQSEDAFIRFALNGITTSGYTVEQAMTISSTREGRTGSTQVTQFDDSSLREAVRQTERLTEFAPANPEQVPPLGAQTYERLDHFDEGTARARNQQMIPHVGAVIEGAKAKKLVAAGFFERSARASVIANKAGNFGFTRATDARLTTTVRTPEGSSSGWASQPAVRISEIDGQAVARRAIEKCTRWLNPQRLEPGRYTVVLEPTATGDLIQLLGFQMQARAAEEGRSFLTRKGGGTLLGDKLFPDTITLRSDPLDARFPSLPWSSGGLPNGRVTWIDKGVLSSLWYDRYWAAKAQKPPTPAPGNLVLEGGEATLDELIKGVERGLLVTRFWYIRSVNPQTGQVTGLTRDGLFLVENGKVTTPVVNLRFNESPARLLQNVVRLGRAERVRGGEGQGMIAPAAVVKEFPFTSVSDAV